MPKNRLITAILSFCLMLGSCNRQNDLFILEGTLQNSTSDSILVCGLDLRFDRTDTIRCQDGHFTWSYKPDTVTALILTLTDGRQFPVFAEKGVTANITIPSDSGQFILSGGQCNDAFYSFYNASICDSTLEMTVARIDSFIIRDPFSEVTPYLLFDMVRKYHATTAAITPLINKMSGNMQDAPFIISLKSEMKDELAKNSYLSQLVLRDTTGTTVEFSKVASANTILCCLWGSWNEDKSREARKAMKGFEDKYKERKLTVIDMSVDMNFERWKQSVAKDTLDWKSYVDLEGWESNVIKYSAAHDVPVYLLISTAKRVTFKSESLEEIEMELNRTLPKPSTSKKETKVSGRLERKK